MVYQGFFEILMITLISRKKLGGYKIMRNTVNIFLKLVSELVVGSVKQYKHKIVIKFKIFRISYGDGLETPMDAVILVLKSPQLTGTPWMIWSQVRGRP